MKIDDMTSLRCFKSIYETRSLTKSSTIMNLSKAALSKRLEALETNLGFKLFTRTKGSLIPTIKADDLISKVRDIISRVEDLEFDTRGEESPITKIKMTCTATMSQRFLGKILQDYQKSNPNIIIELVVTDSVLELTEHGIDLCIRYSPDQNSQLVGKKIGPLKLVAVATPDYLSRTRKINSIEDLLHHELLFIDHHLNIFKSRSKAFQEQIKKTRRFITNDSPLITQLVFRGKGIGIRSHWDVIEGVRNKELAFALPESSLKSLGDVWILSAPDRLKSQSIRSFYDFLFDEIRKYF